MIKRILVANRGEIARRVIVTARRLGIETVAVHSDADADLPFVREADVAVRLPGNSPAETYLDAALVLEAARHTGADAIHPGYGFLSENADFARSVTGAGLTWIGPAPESIVSMGSKVESKKLMSAAGVPVLGDFTPDTATEADLPLLVKASAGGGGRGMRIVRELSDLSGEITAAQAEAESAFGDGTVFVEPYVEHSRHVEVQVVGDRHGEVLVLGERDCSIQRRHQKVVEESPAPNLAAEVAAAMHEAARDAAKAIDYVGAGTVEFLYDPEQERFFFLEMNTRLQVEHPVTEAVFGVDLVELQIAVAEGGSLPTAPSPRGHAIEVRLYAEDPAQDWQPQSGRLVTFDLGEGAAFTNPVTHGLRVDSGFESGSEVSTYYDAMLAKVIAWAPTRAQAARALAGALRRAKVHGLVTNRDLLVATLEQQAFLAGEVSTDFFERTGVLAAQQPGEPDRHQLFAAAVMLAERDRARRVVQQGMPVAWRNVVSQPQRTAFAAAETEHVVEWYAGRDGYAPADPEHTVEVLHADESCVRLRVDRISVRFDGVIEGDQVHVDGAYGSASLRVVPRFTDPADQVATGSLLAPMPGTVVSVTAEAGAEVAAGDPILVLEAMKMQHSIKAPQAGTLTTLTAREGQQVAAGDVLAVVEPTEGENA